MKKLIALLLAVSTMSMSTVALADTYDSFELYPIGSSVSSEHSGTSRNYTTSSSSGNVTMNGVTTSSASNYGSPIFRATSSGIATLPAYRAGDVLTFALLAKSGDSVVKVTEGDVLTFICSKQDDTDHTNDNVQYLDQVTLTPSSSTNYIYCTFKLRDSLTDGRYKLEMNLNGITNTFAFLIATPSVELLYVNNVAGSTATNKDKYYLKYGDAYCFGKATITGGGNFSQVDTDFGFVFNKNTSNEKSYLKHTNRDGDNLTADADAALQASITHNGNQEIEGEAQYFFRMVIEDVYEFTVNADGTEARTSTDDAIYSSLPDVDVYLND